MSKHPIAVLIGDIHYNLTNLAVADKALKIAIQTANELDVPLLANGDTHDSKALMRAECVNALIKTFGTATNTPIVNIGNHDLTNAKSSEHALNFLLPYAEVVSAPQYYKKQNILVIPYHDDLTTLLAYISQIPKGSTLIMHQGIKEATQGTYIQDHSAVPAEALKDYRVIASHYHNRQDIGSNISLLGSPYTTSWGEAGDSEKGYHILYSDHSLGFCPLDGIRRHVVEKIHVDEIADKRVHARLIDLIKIELSGPKEKLDSLTREQISDSLDVPRNMNFEIVFKYDNVVSEVVVREADKQNSYEVLDNIIDTLNVSAEQKLRVKNLWRASIA